MKERLKAFKIKLGSVKVVPTLAWLIMLAVLAEMAHRLFPKTGESEPILYARQLISAANGMPLLDGVGYAICAVLRTRFLKDRRFNSLEVTLS